VVPRVTFIDPEVASVGLTTSEAHVQHKELLVGRYEIRQLGRAATENVHMGLIKIIVHPKTRKILGGHVIGASAGELIHEIALSMYLNAPIDKLAGMIHAFPTYSEGIKAAASSLSVEM